MTLNELLTMCRTVRMDILTMVHEAGSGHPGGSLSAAEIMTGTIIIEQVFTIPGTGRLLVSSIGNRDFPVVQAIIVILAAWIVIVNFVADMLNHWMDPRRQAGL